MESLKSHGKLYTALRPDDAGKGVVDGVFTLYRDPARCAFDARGRSRLVAEVEVVDPWYGNYEEWPFGTFIGSVAPVRVLGRDELADALEAMFLAGEFQARFMSNDVATVIRAYSLQDASPTVTERVRGYKALHQDMTAGWGNMRYELGTEYDQGGIVAVCNRGYHFCRRLVDVFEFLGLSERPRLFETEAWGRVVDDTRQRKSAATCIRLVREISPADAYRMLRDTPVADTRDEDTVRRRLDQLRRFYYDAVKEAVEETPPRQADGRVKD